MVVLLSDYEFDPVSGEPVLSLPEEVIIKRKNERAGDGYFHFSRAGYQITLAI